MTKIIHLTQGQSTKVDDWRFDELSEHRWCAWWNKSTRSFYAVRNSKKFESDTSVRKVIRMHDVIAKPPYGKVVDHVNHDTLYNLEANLRVCTKAQNNVNQRVRMDNKSGYKGVSFHKGAWKAQISVGGEVVYLGLFPTAIEAAVAYDEEASKLYGEFAFLNFPYGESKHDTK